jgi:hypothetical protein
MKKAIHEILCGKNSIVSGLLALAVICAIGLGCFCNRDKFESLTGGNSSTPSPSASPSASPAPTKEFKKSDPSKNEVPGEDEMQEIVKRTLLDFNDGLQKKDFTDFHGTVAKLWQKRATPEDMKTSFQSLVDGEADLSPIRTMTARFTRGPEITKTNGMKTLEAAGEYPTPGFTTKFELKYVVESNEWKLVGISVYTGVKKKP